MNANIKRVGVPAAAGKGEMHPVIKAGFVIAGYVTAAGIAAAGAGFHMFIESDLNSQTSSGMAAFGDSLLFGRPLRDPADRYRRMASVNAAQVQTVAREILRPEGLVATIVGSFTPARARKAGAIIRAFD